MRRFNLAGCIVLAMGLGGCSLYPIPDDVSSFSTEQIVRYTRCEIRSAILNYLERESLIFPPFTAEGIGAQIKSVKGKEKKIKEAKTPMEKEKAEKAFLKNERRLLRVAKVGVVYTFDFNITEHNRTAAEAGFKLPWLTNVLDAGATASIDLTRQGSRVFGTEDSWDDLIVDFEMCAKPWQRPGNIVYPLTGSIGAGRVVETFIDIDDQGGAKDNFVDTLTFTTSASGGADATVKLEPVPKHFRPVLATAEVSASRLDIHKLTISLAFPQDIPRAITGVVRRDGDLNAPFDRPPLWQARYNLCVADARTRESSFKQLRLTDPVVYCITYADEFAPQYGRQSERAIAVTLTQRSGTGNDVPGRGRNVAPQTNRSIMRPNRAPGGSLF